VTPTPKNSSPRDFHTLLANSLLSPDYSNFLIGILKACLSGTFGNAGIGVPSLLLGNHHSASVWKIS
jgi:hypothetical protein